MELLALALLFVLVIFIGILLKNSIVIIRGDEQVYLERKYFGKQMPDGRTVALRDEVGLQARVLGPGTHFLVPFLYRTRKEKFYEVPKDCVGLQAF